MAITVAVTLGGYVVIAGTAGAVVAVTGSDPAGQQAEFEGIPAEPCATVSRSQLGSVSALLPSASFSESGSSCSWFAEFSDGTLGTVAVSYRLPTDDDGPVRNESAAEDEYEERADELIDGVDNEYRTLEVLDSRELDLGDEAVVSHYRNGSDNFDMSSQARVLVLVEDVLIEVGAGEPWEDSTGEADFTDDEELLIDIAERAVTVLEQMG